MSKDQLIDNNKYLESLRKLPAKRRLDAIIDAPAPEAIVKSMNAHELLMTIDEIGGENALELLELMQPAQVQELLDLCIWEHDRLIPEKAGHYLSLLFEANSERAVSQIDGLDIELVGLIFKMVADIYDTSLNEEPEYDYDIMSKSPGGRFYVCFSDHPENKGLAQAMYNYLETLYGIDIKRALTLLEQVRFELASGLEEQSFRFRNNRMLDMGILPHEERLLYFSTLSMNQIKKGEKAAPAKMPDDDPNASSPLVPWVNSINDKYPFLKRAIADSSPEEASNLLANITHASLNMHAALAADFGDMKKLKETVEYVKTLAEFGLVQSTEGKLDQAAFMLRANDMRSMIRLGRTTLVNLRKTLGASALDKSYLFGHDYSAADSPLREVARALMLSEPRYYEGLLDPRKLTVRFFGSLAELSATLKAVHELQFRGKLIGPEVLGCSLALLKDQSQLSHAGIYARYLINAYLNKDEPLSAIDDKELKHIFNKSMTLDDDFVSYAKEYAQKIAHKLADNSDYNLSQALEQTNNFSTAVLIQLEQNPGLLLG